MLHPYKRTSFTTAHADLHHLHIISCERIADTTAETTPDVCSSKRSSATGLSAVLLNPLVLDGGPLLDDS